MAKKLHREKIQLDLVVNGNSAQAELGKLERQTRDLRADTKALNEEKRKLAAQNKKGTAEWERVTQKIKQNNTQIKSNELRMRQLQKTLGINGLTMRQLSQEASRLRLQLQNMVPGTAQHKKLQAELKAINTRIKELRINSVAAESSLSRLAGTFNKYAALGASVIATGTGMVLSLQRMIDYNGKLSDAQADVMKTTGLTKDQVDELTKSFGALNTRTARIELLELAAEVGRLGYSSMEDIQDFTEVFNMMKVALGDILSDEQIREVGKLTNVYKVAEQEGLSFKDSLLAVGSALNEVGATGANTEEFLVNYLKRQAGVAVQARVSAADNIGYAATFDEIGQSVEVSATAMNKVWMDMFKNTGTYANIAGMELNEFTELLNTDSNEAMIRFLEGLNGNNEGLSVMVEKLSDLEVGGARGAQALSAIAGNTELLRRRQVTANNALAEGTSLLDEYNIKNNNLAANLEKIKRRVLGFFTSETLVKSLENFLDWFAKFIGASEDAEGSVTRFRERLVLLLKIILILITAVISYNAALRLSAMWTARAEIATRALNVVKARTIVLFHLARAGALLYAAAKALLTGNTVRATAAMKLFRAAMMATPWGVVAAAVTALATAYFLFSSKTEEAHSKQQMLNESLAQARRSTAESVARLRIYQSIAEDVTKSEEARINAVKELNKIIPNYNKNLDLSSEALATGKTHIDNYIEALQRQAQAQYLADKITSLSKKILEVEGSALEDHIAWYESLWNVIKSGGDGSTFVMNQITTAVSNQADEVDRLNSELTAAKAAFADFINQNPETLISDPVTTTVTGSTGSDTQGTDTRANDLKRAQDELLKINREYFNNLAALQEDSFRKELERLDMQHQERIADLSAKAQEALAQADSFLAGGDTDTASVYLSQYHALLDMMEVADSEYLQTRSKILATGMDDWIQKMQDNFEREQVLRETEQAKALAAVAGNEDLKQQLQEKFNKENLAIQQKHLEELSLQIKEILGTESFEGFNIDILTDAQLQAIKDKLADLGLSIEEINILLAQMQGKSVEGGLEGLGDGMQTDFLGFTLEQWETTFSNLDTLYNKLEGLTMMLQGMQAAWGMYHDYVNASERKSLMEYERGINRRKNQLKTHLDSGIINQRQYNAAIEEEERKLDKKRAELEYKAAMRKWQSDLINAIVGTAMATINGYQTQPFFPLGMIMGTMAGILGTLQIATVRKNKPVKGFESGFYDELMVRRAQDGRMFNAQFGGESRSGVVDKPTVFLAGEGGKNFPEMIIDGRTMRQLDPLLKEQLYSEIARVRGFENGHYANPGAVDLAPLQTLLEQNAVVMSQMTTVLNKLQEDGVLAVMDNDMRNLHRLRKELRKMESIENKANNKP